MHNSPSNFPTSASTFPNSPASPSPTMSKCKSKSTACNSDMMRALFLLLTVVWLPAAFAFPEMARHGYTQCTACHVSPAGGGVLTEYGRELSSDLLSTWSHGNESAF